MSQEIENKKNVLDHLDPSGLDLFGEVKEILKHSTIYGLGNIASKAIGFVMIPIYTRFLTPSDYGIIELLDLIISILGLILYDLIIEAVFRFYYKYRDVADRQAVVSTALIMHIGISMIIAGIVYLLVDQITKVVIGPESYVKFLKLSLISFIFMQINAIPFGFLRVQQKSTLYISVSLTNLVIGLTLNILLIVEMQWGVWGVLYSNLISNGLAALILLPLTFRRIGIRFELHKMKEMFKYGVPLIPAGLSNFSLNFSNRIFLNRFVSLGEVGLFALGSRFGFMISVLIIQPFLDIWDAKMFEVADRQDAKKLYARILTYTVFVTMMAALILSVIIEDVMKIIVAEEFRAAHRVVPVISLGYLFQIFYYNFYARLLLTNRTHYVAGILGLSALVNIAVNWIWIPRYGMMGAAWAMAGSHLLVGFLTFLVASKVFPIDYEWRRIALMSIAAISIYIFLGRLDFDYAMVSLVLKGLGAGTFPFLLYFLGFFYDEEINFIKNIVGRASSKMFRSKEFI